MGSAAVAQRRASRKVKAIVAGLVVAVLVLAGVAWLGPRSHPEHGGIADTFQVPSSRWFGLSGMEAQVTGTLSFDGACPVLVNEEVGEGILVFPWAVGVTYEDGTRAVVHRITGGLYAAEGEGVDAAGGWDEPGLGRAWQSACADSDVAANIYVNSWP